MTKRTFLLLPIFFCYFLVDVTPQRRFRSHLSARLSAPTFPRCPPEGELLPCVCILTGTEVQVTCENSELGRVQAALEILRQRSVSVQKLSLVANRISVIPGRFFVGLKVTKLSLMDNEITSISWNAFDGLENYLMHIYIRESLLQDVPYDTFKNLRELRSLSMENTALVDIPRLYSLPHLESLKIDDSLVSKINPETFRVMPSMRKLQVTKSNLNSLGDNSMEGLVYLKEINLAGNNISWVHPGAFRNLEMVEKLSLSGNQIENAGDIIMSARELRSLKSIDVSRNKIRFLERGTFVDMPSLEEVNLSHNLLEKVDHEAMYKLPNLNKLDLSHNNIYHVEGNVFNVVPSLAVLNLAYNNLSFIRDIKYIYNSLPNLNTLDLTANSIAGGNDIFFGSHPKLQTLNLNQNIITKLSKNLFQNLPNLRELLLSQNRIRRESDTRIWELPKLQILDLSQNYLNKVDGNLLFGLTNLRKFDVSLNMIKEISPKAFFEVLELRSFNISRNKLGKLYPNTFKQVSHLYELDVSYNELSSLESGLLSGLSSLENFHISDNQIMNIDSNTFSDTVKLKTLDLSSNFLKQLPSHAISKLMSLKSLNLRNNAITRVRAADFNQMRVVETIDLSQNHIQGIDRGAFAKMGLLKKLDISVNYIQSIPSNLFENLKLIEALNASHNFITSIGKNAFENVTRLKIVDLTNNSLTSIGETFHDMPSLQGLFLNHNYINKLTNQSFINLPSLNVLFFATNGLQTFETGTFYNLSSLMYLDLQNNSLTRLGSYSFSSLKMLKELKLSQNQISSIENYALLNLPSLQRLELQDNVIIHIEDFAFDRLFSVKFLNLSRNGLQEVPEKCLLKVPALDVLDLSWNYITEIRDSSFHGLQWLTILLLHNNDLCHLSRNAFNGPRSLRVLMLHNNQMKRLHLSALRGPIQSLSLLDMSGNPFVCDCELIWLREYLQQEEDRIVSHMNRMRSFLFRKSSHGTGRTLIPNFPSPMHGQPVCSGPPQYAGMPITQVPPEAFFCDTRFRRIEERREKCVPRFINPEILRGQNSGNGISADVLNALLKLSNLTEMVPGDEEALSFLDYQNPIVVSGLSELISNYSKHNSLHKGNDKMPIHNHFKSPVLDTAEERPKKHTSDVIGSDFVTGDTPTIYAGLSPSSDEKTNEETKPGGLFGFRLPALPNILDTIGKIGLPNLGLNVDWGGLPFGRIEEGSVVPNRGGLADHSLPHNKPTRGPDSVDGHWTDSGKLKVPPNILKRPDDFRVTSEGIRVTPPRQSGRGNGTNHAKFYNIFSGPLPDVLRNYSKSTGSDLTSALPPLPISFAEPSPETSTEEEEKKFIHPFVRSKPSPNSGTPFLPGLVTNKERPRPLVPNRTFQENRQNEKIKNHELPTPRSTLRFPEDESHLKFPDDEEDYDNWKWSPPDNGYPPLKASPHYPGAAFRPMKTLRPRLPLITDQPQSEFDTSTSLTLSFRDFTTNHSPSSHKRPVEPDGMILPLKNHPQTNVDDKYNEEQVLPNITENRLMQRTSQIPSPSSTSPYDDWTKSFVNDHDGNNLLTTPEQNIRDTTTQSFLDDNSLIDTFETTNRPPDTTEMFIPVSLLSNTLHKTDSTTSHPEDRTRHTFVNTATSSPSPVLFEANQTTPAEKLPTETRQTTNPPQSLSDGGFTDRMLMSEAAFTTSTIDWQISTEQTTTNRQNDNLERNRDIIEKQNNLGRHDSINKQNNLGRHEHITEEQDLLQRDWWPPSSLGNGVTLVQGDRGRQTYPNRPLAIIETIDDGESTSHGVKHISPSRSISLGTGSRVEPAIKIVDSTFAQGVDHPLQYEDEDIRFEEVEIITEASPPRRKQAGVMDWYFSNYHREYDPDGPIPIGGNKPPPNTSSLVFCNPYLISGFSLYYLLILFYFSQL